MRTKEDNLLKLAERYEEESLIDYDSIDESELNKIFAAVIRDYKKIYRKCSSEGIDPGDLEVNEYRDDFKLSTAEEKEELIKRVEERIASLADICDAPPEEISEKYAREKDLVSLFNIE